MKSKITPKLSPEIWIPLRSSPRRSTAKDREEAPPLQVSKDKYFHRDLSWLHFNDRVLSEAADDAVPPLERLRFAGIVSSNLDEFFMVRVAEIMRKASRRGTPHATTKMTAPRVLTQIRDQVLNQKARQAAVLQDILSTLIQHGLIIYTDFSEMELDKEIEARLPRMEVIVRRLTDPLPTIGSNYIHIFIRFPEEYAIVRMVDRNDRLIRLPSTEGTFRYALLERWMAARAAKFFPDKEVLEAFPFKIIRDADLRYRPDEEDTLEEQIYEAIQKRSRARIVRMEVDSTAYSEGALFIATALGLGSGSLYRYACPLDLRGLGRLYNLKTFRHLRYPSVQPLSPPFLNQKRNVFKALEKQDVLLHHPYDSFDVIVRFLKQAARDPQVTRIYHTMYRTTRESPIMNALKEAVRLGKKVTVYVEIKARFDELNNLRWADELRNAGVRVIRPLGGFKVHCKLTQIFRKERGEEKSYLHLGTGNYHPTTALQYTDLGLLTNDVPLGKEIASFYSALAQRKKPSGFSELMVAPGNLHRQFERLIKEETENQLRGGRGHIIAKLNSLVDKHIINALYGASKAGVKVELLVRGICCLKPGVKGLSENIRVTSIIDRFLEHSRIYYFRANGAHKLYLSSADWMPRNFYLRYEIAFPVKDALLRRFLREVVLNTSLSDNSKSWNLRPDGTYIRSTPLANAKLIRSQIIFEELARNRYKGTILEDRPKLTGPRK